jgi:alkanesulfonate monooxygenase SsuD/methylene tetrahydromethanopterin reductase-like flavin-dependent oxidoreductase (luciferase family)
MQIGLNGGGPSLGRTIADAQRAESEGFAAYAMAGDSTSTLALVGAETESIRLLTAVVPIFGIHPAVIAGQARVAHEASDGRFTLGIGLSHAVMIEGRMGFSFERPAARMREYLQILMPLLRGEAVEVSGEFYTYQRGGARNDRGGTGAVRDRGARAGDAAARRRAGGWHGAVDGQRTVGRELHQTSHRPGSHERRRARARGDREPPDRPDRRCRCRPG